MSRARDDAKRNMRGQFATTHADGSPVGATIVGYQDGCVEALNEQRDIFAMSIAETHEPHSHAPEHRALRTPYSFERWDDVTRVDDYGWDDE